MGLVARAAGGGMNVCILQFVKAKKPKKGQKLQSGEWPISSEILFFDYVAELRKRPQLKLKQEKMKMGKVVSEQWGAGFVGILGDKKERAQHIEEAKKGLARAQKILQSGTYDLIVLDELVSALELKLVTERDIINLIKSKPSHLHLAYTGHDSFPKIIGVSDMVSEINMIKHPYYQGLLAQRGIDF